jgi:hypothetical protein
VVALGHYAMAYEPPVPGSNQPPLGPENGSGLIADHLYLRATTIYGGFQRDPAQRHRQGRSGALTMDFQFSDEQKLVSDGIDRWLRDRYAFEHWRKASGSEHGFDEGHWREMADLGWLAIAVPEAAGGLGGGAVDQMIVMEGVGRGLVLEPYLSSAVLGPPCCPPAIRRWNASRPDRRASHSRKPRRRPASIGRT